MMAAFVNGLMNRQISTTVALPSLRVSASVSDPPAVAAAYVYSGQFSLGVRAKVAAGINPQGKCNCSVKEAAERAAADDHRSLTSLIEKLLSEYLRGRGYLPKPEAGG